jgi:F-type H+-transporting ATPase subunit b
MFNGWTFLFQAINFLVLACVLHRLLYRPLHDAIDQRRQATAAAQADAERARQEAECLQKQLHEQLAQVEIKRQAMIHEARQQAEADCQNLRAESERALEQRRVETAQALAREHDEMLQAAGTEVVARAIELTGRLLAESAERTLDGQLALRLAETLRQLTEGQRDQLRGQWRPEDGAHLEIARELDGPVLDELSEAVAAVLGRPVELTVHTRPDLLGGARVRLAGQVWDASLAGQFPEVMSRSPQSAARRE